jgi:uncharacterized protein YciI
MHYLLFYRTVEHFVAKRAPYREVHLQLAREAAERGELIMGGALDKPANGAVLVFKGEDESVARSFAENDPYVQNGLITSWEVRPWQVVIGA